jgi:hypothetical protein
MPRLTCDLCETSSHRTDVFVTVKQGDGPMECYCSRACAVHALVRDLSLALVKMGEQRDAATGIKTLIPKEVSDV